MPVRVVSVLRKDGVILRIYTNNLAAYVSLQAHLPLDEVKRLPSYSTINRRVKSPGNSFVFQTVIGTFILQKLQVHSKAY